MRFLSGGELQWCAVSVGETFAYHDSYCSCLMFGCWVRNHQFTGSSYRKLDLLGLTLEARALMVGAVEARELDREARAREAAAHLRRGHKSVHEALRGEAISWCAFCRSAPLPRGRRAR